MKAMTIRLISPLIALAFVLGLAFAMQTSVFAQPDIQESLCQGGGEVQLGPDGRGTCARVTQGSESGLNQVITNIVNVFSLIVGIVAVVMMIIGGFRYITSGGDSGNVTGAKNTILYAIIGLVIVALAQFIVRFVLSKSTDLT